MLSLPWARADQAGHRQEAEAAGLWAGTWQKTGCRLSMPRTRLAGSWLRVRLGLSPASGGAHQSPPPGPGALPAPSGIPSALQLQNALLSGQTATCSHRRKLGPTVITSGNVKSVGFLALTVSDGAGAETLCSGPAPSPGQLPGVPRPGSLGATPPLCFPERPRPAPIPESRLTGGKEGQLKQPTQKRGSQPPSTSPRIFRPSLWAGSSCQRLTSTLPAESG